MLEIKVCVGSSCHIKGGAKVLKQFKALIDAHDLGDKIDLAADLCLNNCIRAPNVIIGDVVYGGVTPDIAEEFFANNILARMCTNADAGDNHNQ